MSKIEIDFNTIKYNLYEILNVSPQTEESKIKKSFMKLIKNFHPDKNSELEEEIYYHIILANQILLNKDTRKKYDTYLVDRSNTFNELKDSFDKTIKNTNVPKDGNISIFNNKFEELNKKHGYNNNTSNSTMEQFSKIKSTRNNNDVMIQPENIKSNDIFNEIFNMNKSDNGKFKDVLVRYEGNPSELSTYVIGEHYTNLCDLDKLYIEDSVQSANFSSLNNAFSLQSINVNNEQKKSYSDMMKEYQAQTEMIKNMKASDFSNK
jgi:curved DNA-binding protein CbpA